MPKKIIISILLIIILLGLSQPALAESEVEITSQTYSYTFGNQIIFQAELNTDVSPEEIKLIVEAPGLTTFVGAADFTPPRTITYAYSLISRPLRAFSTITYRYHITLEGGEIYTSPDYTFEYIDNRYDWKSIKDGNIFISWYEEEDDAEFGYKILDAARKGQAEFEALLPNKQSNQSPIHIYAYPSASELQSTLMMSGQTWVAGHADAEIGSIIVSLPPGQNRPLEILRQVPHEMAHILLYRIMGDGYKNLPRWLNEGIASHMEASPNPDYRLYLEKSYEDGTLMPLEELCLRFPSDAAGSFLAYAEANSLTNYIIEHYGKNALRNLVSAYETGVSCNRGVEIALDKNLEELEKEWQNMVLGSGNTPIIGGDIIDAGLGFSPWLVIFGAIFAPLTGFVIFRGLKDKGTERDDE